MQVVSVWLPRLVALVGFAVCALVAPAPGVRATGDNSPLGLLTEWLAGLLPIGDLAFRPRLVGAACAGAAALVCARMVMRLAERPGPSRAEQDDPMRNLAALTAGTGAGLFLAVALPFGSAVSGQPLQGPLSLLVLATAHLAVPVMRGGDARRGLLLALLAGFGLAAHPAYRWALGGPLLLVFAIRLRRGARWPLLVPLVVVVAAVSVRLLGPVSGAAAASAAATTPVTAAALAGWTIDTLGVLACVVAGLGAVHLAGERRGLWPLSLWLAIAGGGVAAAVFGAAMAAATGALMITLAIAGLIGSALFWLGKSAGSAGPYLACAVGIMVVVAPAMITWATFSG